MLTSDRIVIDGLGDITQDVIDELRSGENMRHVMARVDADAIAAEEAELERHHMSFGYFDARIPEDAFHYWGQRLGYECWNDEGFIREFKRDNEQVRIRNTPRNTTVRVGEVLPRGTILDPHDRIAS